MKRFLLKFLIGWAVNTLGIYICAAYVLNNFDYNGPLSLVIISLIFTLIFLIARPLLKILTLPFYFISPILFLVFYSFILFGISVMQKPSFLSQKLMEPIDIKTALFAGLILMGINMVASIFK